MHPYEKRLLTDSQGGKLPEYGKGSSIGAVVGGLGAIALTALTGGAAAPLTIPLAASAFGLGSSIGGAVGGAVDEFGKPLEDNQSTPPVNYMDQGKALGYYKEGGSISQKLKSLMGGSLFPLGQGLYLARGNSHAKNGISGDTDMDGHPDLEFEGGEIYDDNSGYIISRDISNKYTRKFKSLGTTPIDNITRDHLISRAIRENEEELNYIPQEEHFSKGGRVKKKYKPKYNAWKGRAKKNYARGGIVDVSDSEYENLINMGYKLEVL